MSWISVSNVFLPVWFLARGLWPLAFGLWTKAYGQRPETKEQIQESLSATNGSTLAARRAGTYAANIAIEVSNNDNDTSVRGSVGPTSNSRLVKTRVAA